MSLELLEAARRHGAIIATAESCTGGMISAAITDTAGSSEIFDRGFVTYTNSSKVEILGVSEKVLLAHGAVSEEVAAEMALGALRHSGATLAVATTGIAGPGASDFKPEGRVCFGISDGETIFTETVEFGAIGRDNVRKAAVDHAIRLLLRSIENGVGDH